LGHQRKYAALIEMLSVNTACVDGIGPGFRIALLDQERTFEKNLATCAASRALAVALRKQCFVFFGVDIRTDKPSDFARGLPGPKLEAA
jgi:hypothetical protein